MLDGSLGLIHEWDTGCMEEEDSCCCCSCCGKEEAGFHRRDSLLRLLRHKQTRQTRMVQFLGAVLLLLVSGTLLLLVAVVFGGRGGHSPDNQPVMQPDRHSSEARFEVQKQKHLKNASAMLTVPEHNNVDEKYLQWESNLGNAFCHGGFSYSNGSLVVPRAGIYRVFLQITFENREDLKCVDDHDLSIEVLKIHHSYNVDVRLLTSVDSVECSKERWSKSLYTAGLFYLEAGSRLRVTSSKPELIVKAENQVFFGADLLPQ